MNFNMREPVSFGHSVEPSVQVPSRQVTPPQIELQRCDSYRSVLSGKLSNPSRLWKSNDCDNSIDYNCKVTKSDKLSQVFNRSCGEMSSRHSLSLTDTDTSSSDTSSSGSSGEDYESEEENKLSHEEEENQSLTFTIKEEAENDDDVVDDSSDEEEVDNDNDCSPITNGTQCSSIEDIGHSASSSDEDDHEKENDGSDSDQDESSEMSDETESTVRAASTTQNRKKESSGPILSGVPASPPDDDHNDTLSTLSGDLSFDRDPSPPDEDKIIVDINCEVDDHITEQNDTTDTYVKSRDSQYKDSLLKNSKTFSVDYSDKNSDGDDIIMKRNYDKEHLYYDQFPTKLHIPLNVTSCENETNMHESNNNYFHELRIEEPLDQFPIQSKENDKSGIFCISGYPRLYNDNSDKNHLPCNKNNYLISNLKAHHSCDDVRNSINRAYYDSKNIGSFYDAREGNRSPVDRFSDEDSLRTPSYVHINGNHRLSPSTDSKTCSVSPRNSNVVILPKIRVEGLPPSGAKRYSSGGKSPVSGLSISPKDTYKRCPSPLLHGNYTNGLDNGSFRHDLVIQNNQTGKSQTFPRSRSRQNSRNSDNYVDSNMSQLYPSKSHSVTAIIINNSNIDQQQLDLIDNKCRPYTKNSCNNSAQAFNCVNDNAASSNINNSYSCTINHTNEACHAGSYANQHHINEKRSFHTTDSKICSKKWPGTDHLDLRDKLHYYKVDYPNSRREKPCKYYGTNSRSVDSLIHIGRRNISSLRSSSGVFYFKR